jgi:hypothetical protein
MLKLVQTSLLSVTVLSCTTTPSWAQIPSGVYSSVRYNRESGDVLGDQIEIRLGPKPVAVVTLCEGDCYGGKIWPVLIRGNHIEITVQEDLADQDGHPVKGKLIPLVGEFRDGVLRVQVPGEPLSREILKRVGAPKPNQTAQLACGRPAC